MLDPESGGSLRSARRDSLGRAGEVSTYLPTLLRRLVHVQQMDFEYAFTQMVYLATSPSKVYKLTRWRKETKNRWARDDPAFVVILSAFITVCSLAFGLALGASGPLAHLWLVLYNLGAFYGCGLGLATAGWYVSNNYFRVHHSHSVEQEVEWVYAFDIHCNAYFPMFVLLYVVQFLLLPLLVSSTLLATLASNTLYAVAFGAYHYVSFLGYMNLPFLHKDQVTFLLYPIGGVFVAFLCFTMFQINATRLVCGSLI